MKQLLFITILIALLPTLCIHAQVTSAGTKHFAKDGVEFDYPAGWTVTNGGSGDSRYMELANESKTLQLVIYWETGPVLDCQFEGVRRRINQGLVDGVAKQLHTTSPSEVSWITTRFEGNLTAEGKQLHGLMGNTPMIADVYSFLVPHLFLNLFYLRAENDEAGKSAWETVRTTLRISPPTPAAAIFGGVHNGRAVRLPKPAYPDKARSVRASGAVTVQVLIDELGNVVSACAISGHPLLRAAAEKAALLAKYTPTTLNGTPVRVSGSITFNFVAP